MERRKSTRAVLAAALIVLAVGATPAGADPTRAESVASRYSFRVEIDGVSAGQFTSVDGLSIEQEVIEYQNGDDPLTRKRPGRVKYGDITLKRGYVPSSVLNDWIEQARMGRGDYVRKTVTIILLGRDGAELKRWICHECFPKSWKVSSLDDKGNAVLTEEVVIAIEYFEEA